MSVAGRIDIELWQDGGRPGSDLFVTVSPWKINGSVDRYVARGVTLHTHLFGNGASAVVASGAANTVGAANAGKAETRFSIGQHRLQSK